MQPDFARGVARNGYLWWYLDAFSDDARHGLTLIAFIGSVFSPYYASARRRNAGDPFHHIALNVALYGAAGKRWALTERGRESLHQSTATLAIGPSALAWDGAALRVQIDEWAAPIPARIRGRVRLHPATIVDREFSLDSAGRHRWQPIAPCARVEVDFEHPRLRWSGPGYFDSNAGDGALEDAFVRWDWSRASLRDGSTAVLYDISRRGGDEATLAMRIQRSGALEELAPPPRTRLPGTLWRLARGTRSDAGFPGTVERTLEDTPFYARSLVRTRLLGEPVHAMHESLSLDRFRAPWVQLLLPFRMPRWRTARAVNTSPRADEIL